MTLWNPVVFTAGRTELIADILMPPLLAVPLLASMLLFVNNYPQVGPLSTVDNTVVYVSAISVLPKVEEMYNNTIVAKAVTNGKDYTNCASLQDPPAGRFLNFHLLGWQYISTTGVDYPLLTFPPYFKNHHRIQL